MTARLPSAASPMVKPERMRRAETPSAITAYHSPRGMPVGWCGSVLAESIVIHRTAVQASGDRWRRRASKNQASYLLVVLLLACALLGPDATTAED